MIVGEFVHQPKGFFTTSQPEDFLETSTVAKSFCKVCLIIKWYQSFLNILKKEMPFESASNPKKKIPHEPSTMSLCGFNDS